MDSTPTGLLNTIRERRRLSTAKAPGDAPGSLVFEGIKRVDEVQVQAIDYSADHLDHSEETSLEDCKKYANQENPTWIHVTGLHQIPKISRLCRTFGVSDLFIEDILSTTARGKIESAENAIFIQIKVIEEDKNGALDLQQLSLYLTPTTLITFSEGETSIFNPVYRRLQNKRGRLRREGLDYLLWAVLDTTIDHALAALSVLERNLLEIDELIQNDHNAVNAGDLYGLKHELTSLLHLVRPNRDIVHSLRQTSSSLLDNDLMPFLDDLRDNALRLQDECQALTDYAAGMREYLITELNQHMNNIMKVLTCISTIFLPLTFLAGVYGMNFKFMPELDEPWAYPALWVIFIATGVALIVLFRKKHWL